MQDESPAKCTAALAERAETAGGHPATKVRPPVYYFGNKVDYKYRQITSRMPIDYLPTNLLGITRALLFGEELREKKYVHVRYIFWRGYATTLLMYLFLVALCRLRRATLVWTCHNIYEHGFPSKRYNDVIRGIMIRASKNVIVFHRSLATQFPNQQEKLIVANFGSFRDFIVDHSHPRAEPFANGYRTWLAKRGCTGADIVFIGEYKSRKNIEMLLDFALQHESINVLVVSHKLQLRVEPPDNLFVWRQSPVFGELDWVLSQPGGIGFVAHDNYSVPTGVHLYADYGIPIIGMNVAPISCIVKQYHCGQCFDGIDSIHAAYQEVRSTYSTLSENMLRLRDENTWERAAARHRLAFDLSDNT